MVEEELSLMGFYTHTGITFDTTAHSGVPLAAQRIGIRFYNGTSVATSTGYNTVSAADGGWVLAGAADLPGTPVSPWMDTSVGLGGLAALSWESGPGGAFTTIIPEPSSMLLSLLGGSFFFVDAAKSGFRSSFQNPPLGGFFWAPLPRQENGRSLAVLKRMQRFLRIFSRKDP